MDRRSESIGHRTALFIRRPILAFVLNALIVIAGLAGLLGVDVRELPNVDRPVVSVSTSYSGASPETIDREVTAVIEGAVSRVAGVKSISSSSRFGSGRVTVEFRDDIVLDIAATDLREAVARVENSLPDAADAPRIVKSDTDSDAILRIAVTSSRRTADELTALIRTAVFQFLRPLAEERYAAAAGALTLPDAAPGAPLPWSPDALAQLMDSYYGGHERVTLDPEARNARHTYINVSGDAQSWQINQVLVDPEALNDWQVSFRVDLATAREAGRPVLVLLGIGPVAADDLDSAPA